MEDYKSLIIICPQNISKPKDLKEKWLKERYIETLRRIIKKVGGLNTRCIVENKETMQKARSIMGKKKDYVRYKILSSIYQGAFNEIVPDLAYRPLYESLEEIDIKYFNNKIDDELTNLFLKWWHYKPKAVSAKEVVEYNELCISFDELNDWDPYLHKKLNSVFGLSKNKRYIN